MAAPPNQVIGYQSWITLYNNNWLPTLDSAATPIRSPGTNITTLMTWGPITFLVYPNARGSDAALNFNQMEHETASDWAHKEIAGAAIYREWVGENDEIRILRGELFPYRLGGMMDAEIFDAYRRAGTPQLLVGGDGRNLGWFVCEKFSRTHDFISAEGVGQRIQFEAQMARVPVPDPASYFSATTVWSATATVVP